MRRVGSLPLSNVPATMFFRLRRISFAYRLASASVENISVCLAGVLGARNFFGTTDETNQRLGTVSPIMAKSEILTAVDRTALSNLGETIRAGTSLTIGACVFELK